MDGPRSRAAASFAFECVKYEKTPPVARVTINRPQVHNALNFTALRELSRAFEDASWDDAIAVVVLTGAGERAFCTGADLAEQAGFLRRPRDYWKWMGAFIEAQERLRNVGKVTIARLNGLVVGGGNEFNMACDLAVAADDVIIRHVGPARGSVPAAGATQWLPLIVGDRRAREILFLCEEISARTALAWGLVNEVVPRAGLDAAVEALAARLHDKLPEVTRYTKQQLNFWRDLSWHLTVGHARDWLTLHAGAPETQEGIEAFLEKRPVNYAGLRRRLAAGENVEHAWGPPVRVCPHCGARSLPEGFGFCGNCGRPLGAAAGGAPVRRARRKRTSAPEAAPVRPATAKARRRRR